MSKAVLISIKPEWCELIASDEKTIEIRKTKPNLDVPFKVYIYCTKPKAGTDKLWILDSKIRPEYNGLSAFCANLDSPDNSALGNGKVIGEFVCNNIYEIDPSHAIEAAISKESCVSPREMHEYLKGKTGYGLCISDLKIYEQPKELSEFCYPQDTYCEKGLCGGCPYDELADVNGEYSTDCEWRRPIARAPQSWCYVEERTWKD